MKNSAINLTGTILLALSQWLQIFIITRFIGLYEAGIFSLFMAIMAPLVILVRFNFINLIPTYIKIDISKFDFVFYRFISNIFFLIISLLIVIYGNFNYYENFCFIIFILFKLIENKEELHHCYMIKRGEIYKFSKCKVIKALTNIILIIIFALTSNTLISIILSILFSQLISYIYTLKLSNENFKINSAKNIKNIKNIFYLGFGITLAALLSSLLVTIPKYYIQYNFNSRDLGVFSALLFFSTLANNFVITINQSLIKDLVKVYHSNIKAFLNKVITLYIIFSIFCLMGVLCSYFFGAQIIVFIYGKIFIKYSSEIFLLSIFISLNMIFKITEMIMNILNIYNVQVTIHIISLVSLVMMLIINRDNGLNGIFYSMIFSLTLVILLQFLILSNKIITLRKRVI